MDKILIIEDDKDIAELERDYLNLNGYEVTLEADGLKGLDIALENDYDLIIVDLMLPGLTGFEIVKSIREKKEIPLLIISAKNEDIDKIRGLNSGADDYMTKPFSPAELLVRVKTHINRYERLYKKTSITDKTDVFNVGGIEVDPDSRRVYVNNQEVVMTTKEFDLLVFLMKNPDHVFSKSQLYDRIWGEEDFGENATVAVHIQKIRKKIEKNPSDPKYIDTIYGAGYRFNKNV
ncbi:response regulator transcription factor [Acidaminobacter sp. JC074]|uniref:response regulator transcription factor n=1 Tax=Acidaminobacter sp. JC074 TaxID=2530199 RepID=UPI001F0CF910|nr:response regulator transcription factor [Acidaminobacter sp. JC074]MCH4888387.1 response regulator transcription factor [Acidaminobacter sp. JC074]